MAKAYSLDLRERILNAYDGGVPSKILSRTTLSAALGLTHSSNNVKRLTAALSKTHDVVPNSNSLPTKTKCDNSLSIILTRP